MKNTFLIIAASLLLNGCSLLAPEEPPAPVAVEVPVKTTAPVVNRNFPLDKESQDQAWFEHSTESVSYTHLTLPTIYSV